MVPRLHELELEGNAISCSLATESQDCLEGPKDNFDVADCSSNVLSIMS